MTNGHDGLIAQQSTIISPYLDKEVFALSLTNGRLYVPLFAICQVFGIDPEMYISRS